MWLGSDWETWYVMGAFLLNMNEFQFISQQENSKGSNVPSMVSDDPVTSTVSDDPVPSTVSDDP